MITKIKEKREYQERYRIEVEKAIQLANANLVPIPMNLAA